MQWFRDRKTATKLMLGFGVMAALLCILGLEGIRNLSALNARTRDMYEHHVLGLNYLKDGHLQLTTAGKSIRNAMLAQSDQDLEVRIDELHKNREAFLADLDAFQKCLVVEDMKAKAASLREEYYLNANAQDKVVELLRAHHREQGIAQIDTLNKLQGKREQLMAELLRQELDIMKQSSAEVDATARSAEKAAATLMGLAVLLAIVLGFTIARIITRPLALLVEVARKLAAGDVNQTLDYHSGSELGNLASTFNGLIETVKGLLAETSATVEAARQGDLNRRGNAAKFQGAFRELVGGINETLDAFCAPVQEASAALAKVAERDLTARVNGDYKGDFAIIKNSLNQAVENLNAALTEVNGSAQHVTDTAQQMSSASEQIASGAQEQASSLEETASSLEEISSTIKQNAENARQASQLAAGSREAAEKGGQVVNAAVEAMGEINQSSKRIADIITTIDEIAFQTNLLALNAAVEAARAGEQGRGFAVVASEVRNLAQRSATAAKEIKGLIQDSVHKVENGSELVNRSGQTLSEIVHSVKRVTDIVAEIAAASQEQATGIEQVNKATMQMDQVTQANSGQTEEMSSTAQGLSSSAEQLQAMVAGFRLSERQTARTPGRVPSAKTPQKRAARPQVASLVGLAKSTAGHPDGFEEF
ncbi:MAG TPA: methyl-accepting chemotaxis protein [Bryobacteraceae bacterium]|nr:methyl-accepting chemotaxis protein [Bryobacteraceae bacterium]